MEVYFVRHGQTIFNLMSKMQGWSDSPLTDTGIEDLKKTGSYLSKVHFDALYSSDLKRAMDTAEIIKKENDASDLNLKTSKNFREIFFGSFEGLKNTDTWKTIGEPYGVTNQNDLAKKYSMSFVRDAMKKADPLNFAESAEEIENRIKRGFEQLLDENAVDSRILVVTHGTFIKTLMMNFTDINIEPSDAFPDNGSITKTTLNNNGFKVTDFNILPKN
ncbi:histidine phosphatase family protein [Companilactobacillus jidongensis]|uniref:histidine phosphatase family protein n=1 Tax=Companilactobacillus jidongensis TaxID=2486006 RepID=UPI000F7A420F|nr:histidine phosphatase family protein [Companilactobacillus jidongensis]